MGAGHAGAVGRPSVPDDHSVPLDAQSVGGVQTGGFGVGDVLPLEDPGARGGGSVARRQGAVGSREGQFVGLVVGLAEVGPVEQVAEPFGPVALLDALPTGHGTELD